MIDDIKQVSKQTWDKLKLLESQLGKINEEGFTQDLIYTILTSSSTLIAIDTSVTESEKTTGADFFWDLDINNTNIRKLAIQAKRVAPKTTDYISEYSSLLYRFNEPRERLTLKFDYQHELLENFCDGTPYEPYYIFYNTLFSRNTVHTIDVQRTSGSDSEFDNGSETQEIFGITIVPLEVIITFMSLPGRNHHLFTELLYEDETLSLAEFLRDYLSNSTTRGNGPGGNGPGSNGPGGNGPGGNNFNSFDTSDSNNFNPDNQEFGDSFLRSHKLQSTVRDNIVYLYSHNNLTGVENRIDSVEESFHELQRVTQEKNIEKATKIFEKMNILYYKQNKMHSGKFRQFRSILEEYSGTLEINLENIRSLLKEIKTFQKGLDTEEDKKFFREMKRETLKMLTILESQPKQLMSTKLN